MPHNLVRPCVSRGAYALAALLFTAPASSLLHTAFAETPSKTIALFNGRDLDGWTPFSMDAGSPVDATWTLADGVIKCSGKPNGYLRTEGSYRDYRLTVEWRWAGPAPTDAKGKPRNRNSGVLLHVQGENKIWPKSLEAQLMETNAGDFYVINGVETAELTEAKAKAIAAAGENPEALKAAQINRRTPKKQPSSEKPVGEWNRYEITCAKDTVTLTVNGVPQNRATAVSVREGAICLQSEGAAIEFRNVKLEPLD
jgi:hypothetical protein